MSIQFAHPRTIGSESFLPFSQNGWKGLCVPACTAIAEDVDAFLASPETVALDAACRKICRHSFQDGVLYSKLMWAQNDGAFLKHEPISWLKWVLGPSRALRILRVSAQMKAQGHFCAEPVLAARKLRANGRHLNLLVTREVTAPTVEQFVTQPGQALSAETAVRIAAQSLARFHRDGFVHGDFLPRNCCLDSVTKHLFFLDNDKTIRPLCTPFFLQRRNLEQFAYNLLILQSLEVCRTELSTAFLEEYASAAGWDEKRTSRELQNILAVTQARWQRKSERAKNKR